MEPRFTAKLGVVRGTHLGAKRVVPVLHNPISVVGEKSLLQS